MMVEVQAGTGFAGTKGLRAKALRAAAAYCADHGGDFETLSTSENEGPFILGKYPRAEVTFRCLDTTAK